MKIIIAFFFAAFLAGAALAQDHTQNQPAQPQSPPQGWYQQQSGITSIITSIFFLNRDSGWTGIQDGVFATTNGGDTWIKISSQPIGNLHFIDGKNGIGVSGHIMRTIDGGMTWTPQGVTAPVFGPMQVFGLDTIRIYNGSDPATASSNDGGKTWVNHTVSAQSGAMYFIDGQHGFLCGRQILWFGDPPPQQGTKGADFEFTTDGGVSWHAKYCNIIDNLSVIFAIDNQHIYVGGDTEIAYSGMAGAFQSWKSVFPGGAFRTFFFNTIASGYAAGYGGKIIFTNDTGKHWIGQNSTTTSDLQDIIFIDSLTGWACGNQGTIIHTINGGKDWVKQNILKDTLNPQTYPNPANEKMTLGITLPLMQHVTISIMDMTGRLIETPVTNMIKEAGVQFIPLDIHSLDAGTYMLHISTECYDDAVKFIKIAP